MISQERSVEIEARLAELIGVEPDDVRDYVRSYIDVRRVDGRRPTGIRILRGTHSIMLERDPNGTDTPPPGWELPPA